MPTKYKPQLDHVGFDWFNQSNQFHQDLLAVEPEILEKLGFYKAYDCLDPDIAHTEARELINQLSGVISLAAAIRMDGGFKAPNKLIATLEAVEKNPSLIFTHALEPEALCTLALHYQRADERPGTWWWDVDRQENAPLPEPERVRQAASSAIVALKSEAGPGRPQDKVTECLAVKTREIYLRYNISVTRHSELSSTDGMLCQVEAGPFFDFLERLLAPLNRFFASLPKHYYATPISPAYVARMAVELTQDRLQQQRPIRYRKAPEEVGASTTQLPPYTSSPSHFSSCLIARVRILAPEEEQSDERRSLHPRKDKVRL